MKQSIFDINSFWVFYIQQVEGAVKIEGFKVALTLVLSSLRVNKLHS